MMAGPQAARMRSPLPIKNRVDRAVQLVLRARIFFDIWFYFEAKQTRSTIFETMCEYNEFFRFMPHANQVAFVVTTVALFDKRADTISLPNLAREMTRNGQLSGVDVTEVSRLLMSAKPLESKVTILRHKAFAHRSAHTSFDDVFKEASITADQMRQLTEIALRIANKLAEACGASVGFFNELPREDAARMMLALQESQHGKA
jgi:AbiU2